MSMSRLNNILAALESEAIAAPIRYQSAMLEDVEEYRRQVSRLDVPDQGHESLSRIDSSIQRSTVIALESERLGHDTIDDLAVQRERLTGARDRLEDANREIGSTRKLIRGIWINLTTNKLLLGGIIVGEIIIIILIAYIKWFKK